MTQKENLARYITRGASACAARPSIFFPGEDDLPPRNRRHDPLHPGTGTDRQSFPEKLGTINTENLPH